MQACDYTSALMAGASDSPKLTSWRILSLPPPPGGSRVDKVGLGHSWASCDRRDEHCLETPAGCCEDRAQGSAEGGDTRAQDQEGRSWPGHHPAQSFQRSELGVAAPAFHLGTLEAEAGGNL